MGSYLSIITLNVNGLNAPTKRQRLAEWIQKQDPYICCLQETQRVPNRMNPRQNTPWHTLIKLTKIKHKEQILKAAREKQQITHKGIPIRVTADLSIETLQARREWQDILRVMKESNLQPRLLYPARISFKYEREIKSFTDKQRLREFSTTKPTLQQMLKDLLYTGNTKRAYKPKPKKSV